MFNLGKDFEKKISHIDLQKPVAALTTDDVLDIAIAFEKWPFKKPEMFDEWVERNDKTTL